MMPLMWLELIAGICPAVTFAEPTTKAAIRKAEKALGHPVPPALRSLLRETDGATDENGCDVVWSLERVVCDNRAFRDNAEFTSLYMPFDPLLFFADAGNGDQFALLSPPIERDDVFTWNHEDDSRTWVAANIEMYLRGWFDGSIPV